HPELVRAEYALGEVGGFNVFLGDRMFVNVQVAEKGLCWVRARVRGEPGHGSMPREDSAVVKLAAGSARLGAPRLPLHPLPLVRGSTAAQHFTRLGAKWYGFAPVKRPRGLRFADLFHGNDERVPVDGLAWGTRVLAETVARFAR